MNEELIKTLIEININSLHQIYVSTFLLILGVGVVIWAIIEIKGINKIRKKLKKEGYLK
jgi:hypothetical protein